MARINGSFKGGPKGFLLQLGLFPTRAIVHAPQGVSLPTSEIIGLHLFTSSLLPKTLRQNQPPSAKSRSGSIIPASFKHSDWASVYFLYSSFLFTFASYLIFERREKCCNKCCPLGDIIEILTEERGL